MLIRVREAVELGNLDTLIQQQALFDRRLTLKKSEYEEQKNVYGLSAFLVVQCASEEYVNY